MNCKHTVVRLLPLLVLLGLLVACVQPTPGVRVVEKEVVVTATPTPVEEAVTLRVLSLPWPQTPVE